jgi:hypothetical protein
MAARDPIDTLTRRLSQEVRCTNSLLNIHGTNSLLNIHVIAPLNILSSADALPTSAVTMTTSWACLSASIACYHTIYCMLNSPACAATAVAVCIQHQQTPTSHLHAPLLQNVQALLSRSGSRNPSRRTSMSPSARAAAKAAILEAALDSSDHSDKDLEAGGSSSNAHKSNGFGCSNGTATAAGGSRTRSSGGSGSGSGDQLVQQQQADGSVISSIMEEQSSSPGTPLLPKHSSSGKGKSNGSSAGNSSGTTKRYV